MRYIVALFVALLAFTGTALASAGAVSMAQTADLAPPDASVFDLIQPVMNALTSGHPAMAAALALVLCVALTRRFGASRFPFLATDAGGTALTFLGAMGTALAASLAAGSMPSWGMVTAALTLAAGASGGYTAIKRLAAPALRFLESKLPAFARPFMKPLFDVVLWAFEHKGAAKVAKAEAAGQAAVDAKPAQGVAKVTGKTKRFP